MIKIDLLNDITIRERKESKVKERRLSRVDKEILLNAEAQKCERLFVAQRSLSLSLL